MTFEQYLQSKGYSHKTMTTYLNAVERYQFWVNQQGLETEQVTNGDLLSYIKKQRDKGNSQRSIQHHLGSVDHYYSYLKKTSKIDKKPTTGIEIKGVKRKQLHQILEPYELHKIYNEYPTKSITDQRNKVILGLVIYQGVTSKEIIQLQTSAIKAREGLIEVPGGKKSNGRTLKLEPHQVLDIYDYLQRILPQFTRDNEPKNYLFINAKGSTNRTLVLRSLTAKLKQMNVKNLNQIRVSLITKWLKMYGLREVQYRAGHRYISSTENYLQNDIEGLQEEINMYHPLG